MARWWWNGEGWENIFFKRVPTGWVFQAPSPWLFGRGRYYLASETQRAEIIAFFDHMSWRRIIAALLLATVVCGLMAPLALWLIPRLWNSVLLTMLPISIVGGSLINAYFWWTLRPLLAGVPQTNRKNHLHRAAKSPCSGRARWSIDPICNLVGSLVRRLGACGAYVQQLANRRPNRRDRSWIDDCLLLRDAQSKAQRDGWALVMRVAGPFSRNLSRDAANRRCTIVTPASASAHRARPWCRGPGSASATRGRRA
jgi:hypothetical protein